LKLEVIINNVLIVGIPFFNCDKVTAFFSLSQYPRFFLFLWHFVNLYPLDELL